MTQKKCLSAEYHLLAFLSQLLLLSFTCPVYSNFLNDTAHHVDIRFHLIAFLRNHVTGAKSLYIVPSFVDSPKDIGTNDFQDVQGSLSLGIKLYPRTKNMKRGGSRLLQSNFTFFFFHQLTTKLAQSLAVQLEHFIALPFHLLGTVFELQCKYHNCYVCKYHVTFP